MRTLALLAPLLAAGAADAAVRDWPVAGFDRVDLAAAATVEVRTGTRFGLHADGDPELVQRLDPVVERGVLRLRWRPGSPRTELHDRRLHLVVAMPRIAGAAISGAGSMTVGPVSGGSFAADISGAGQLRAPSLAVQRALLTVGGAGTVQVAGRAGQVDARVSGVGSIEAKSLAARAGHVEVSGTGSVAVRVDGPVDGAMSGMGTVAVTGRAQCAIRRSGLGTIRCGG